MSKEAGGDKIIAAKNELNVALRSFGANYADCNANIDCIADLIGELVEKHTNVLNTVNKVIFDLHEEYDFFYEKNLQADYIGTIKNFIRTSFIFISSINKVTEKYKLKTVSISGNSYVTIQRFINTFSDPASKEAIFNEFKSRNISTEGFKQKFFKTMKRKYLKAQLWIGIPLLLLCGAAILFGESLIGKNFNGIQLIFLKALMSLSVSTAGSSLIEGNADYKWSLQKGLTIRAVGWVGVFLLLYFLNPPSPGDVH